jgi:ArsR family transcriptional regulator
MERYTEVFKALSNETRLSILVILNQQELCVCQIEDFLKLSQVRVSRHLTILKSARLVKFRREGLHIYYSIIKPKNEFYEKVFELLKDIECKKTKLKFNKYQIINCEKC